MSSLLNCGIKLWEGICPGYWEKTGGDLSGRGFVSTPTDTLLKFVVGTQRLFYKSCFIIFLLICLVSADVACLWTLVKEPLSCHVVDPGRPVCVLSGLGTQWRGYRYGGISGLQLRPFVNCMVDVACGLITFCNFMFIFFEFKYVWFCLILWNTNFMGDLNQWLITCYL